MLTVLRRKALWTVRLMKLHGLNWLMVLMWWAAQTPRQMVDLYVRLYLTVISKMGVPLGTEQNHSSREWSRPPQVNLTMTWNTHKGLLIFSAQCHSPLCLCHLEKLQTKCRSMSPRERISSVNIANYTSTSTEVYLGHWTFFGYVVSMAN